MVDLMVADIARGYVNTGVFPRADVDPVARIAKGDSRVPVYNLEPEYGAERSSIEREIAAGS